MTDEPRDENADDVEWLKNAFNRANQGDNGTVSETPRSVPKPFEESTRRHDLDLDFETENFQPVTEFKPVQIPREAPEPVDSVNDPKTEALDALEIPESVTPVPVEPVAAPPVDAPAVAAPPVTTQPVTDETSGIDRLDAIFAGLSSADDSAATTVIAEPVAEAATPTKRGRFARAPKDDRPIAATDPQSTAAFRQQLVMVAASIGILILAIGGFVTGRALGHPAPAPVAMPTAEPTATAAREPGKWAFDQLFGGECITPFDGAWSETFTVVDCATDHAAQLVYAGDLATDGAYPSYPGDSHTGNAAMSLCQRKGVLSLGAAKHYSDILVSAAYPVSQAVWESGDTRYYCFVSRDGGANLNGDLAGSLLTSGGASTPAPTSTP